MGLKPGVIGAAYPLAEANGKRGSAYRICHKCMVYIGLFYGFSFPVA